MNTIFRKLARRSLASCCAIIIAAVATATMPTLAAAEPFKIVHTTWVGYGPLYLARDLGYFEEEGVDVELVVIEEKSFQMGALFGEQAAGAAGTVDEFLLYMKGDACINYVLALDESAGGDGIVSTKSITSVADLEGKKVAANEGSVSQFWLNVLLKKQGMSQKDVDLVNMSASDAGTAFMAEHVDAAVTWEPHLTQGKNSEHGHILQDSSKTPGIIVDVLAVTCDTASTRSDEIAAIVKGWNRAVEYWKTNPEKANAIMSKGVGGWLADPEVFAETVAGVRFYDAESNKSFFGSATEPGALQDTVQFAIDIWSDLGRMSTDPTPSELINSSFVN